MEVHAEVYDTVTVGQSPRLCLAASLALRWWGCFMYVADFIERSSGITSPQELFKLLVEAARDEGYDQLAYAALTYREPFQLAGHPPLAIALNYSEQWQRRYTECRYGEVDPVVAFTPRIARPFLWDQLRDRDLLTHRQQLVMNEAHEAGLRNGISVPLHGPSARVAVVSFASQFHDADPQACLSHFNALTSLFHVAFTAIVHGAELDAPSIAPDHELDAPSIALSQRERDCLNWTAQGKSSWDIGMILAISENTVNFHIKNAMRKLGSTSRIVAVLKAVRLGLISIPQF
jgi:DNA-binding CsgD family transcriptional regulator